MRIDFFLFFVADIVHLLRWRRMKGEEVLHALDALLKVSPEEVIKVINIKTFVIYLHTHTHTHTHTLILDKSNSSLMHLLMLD